MSAPILTRWWYVGKQACEVEEDWSEWQIVMEFILKTRHLGNSGTTSAIKDIAKANHGIMKVTEIMLDVTIIKCIHKVWVFPHFKFVQGGDPLTGDVAGYQARLMLLRFYLLWEDLDALLNDGWKQNEEFKTVVSEAADNLKEKVRKKLNTCCEYACFTWKNISSSGATSTYRLVFLQSLTLLALLRGSYLIILHYRNLLHSNRTITIE